MIRPTAPRDTPALVELAHATGAFRPREIEALREVLDDYHAREHAQGHRALTFESDGRIMGFAYDAPSSMSEGGWYLWWIAVAPSAQSRGIGSELLRTIEDDLRARGARVLLIETSSLPRYEPTRRFYLRHGYEVAGVVRDLYADGDDMVVFAKRFLPKAGDSGGREESP